MHLNVQSRNDPLKQSNLSSRDILFSLWDVSTSMAVTTKSNLPSRDVLFSFVLILFSLINVPFWLADMVGRSEQLTVWATRIGYLNDLLPDENEPVFLRDPIISGVWLAVRLMAHITWQLKSLHIHLVSWIVDWHSLLRMAGITCHLKVDITSQPIASSSIDCHTLLVGWLITPDVSKVFPGVQFVWLVIRPVPLVE